MNKIKLWQHLLCKELCLDIVSLLEHDVGDGRQDSNKLLITLFQTLSGANNVRLADELQRRVKLSFVNKVLGLTED